ncbi:hypothetical protein P4B35_17245 [Pontiellaceae bacterium B12227]|nr:hypothetical protein [Pontiellaceae bacterium B12227]
MEDFLNDEDEGSIYESFSDIALCTLVVALLLVTLLAISITQNVSVQINRSKFSGGVMRPSLHLECTVPDFGKTTSDRFAVERALFAGKPYVAVHLFSPSLAMIATDVREGSTVALGEDETFAQQLDLSLYQFLQLAPGIEPGSFSAEGEPTALLIPSILDKQMVYEPAVQNGYRVNADRLLAKRMLSSVWSIYENPTYAMRRPEEYSKARTRIYVETQTRRDAQGEELHFVIIGHKAYKLPEALDDGSLAWLGGFSSGLTEIEFLGESWVKAGLETNKRIEFFDKNGFNKAAEAYRQYSFPDRSTSELRKIYEILGNAGYTGSRMDERARAALAQLDASAALLEGRLRADPEAYFLPPLLAYPEAWSAYVAHCEAEQPDPPKWFYSEFLDRLGFDRLTIEGSL